MVPFRGEHHIFSISDDFLIFFSFCFLILTFQVWLFRRSSFLAFSFLSTSRSGVGSEAGTRRITQLRSRSPGAEFLGLEVTSTLAPENAATEIWRLRRLDS